MTSEEYAIIAVLGGAALLCILICCYLSYRRSLANKAWLKEQSMQGGGLAEDVEDPGDVNIEQVDVKLAHDVEGAECNGKGWARRRNSERRRAAPVDEAPPPDHPFATFALDKRRSTERIQAAAMEAEEAGLAAPPAESDETIQVNVTLSDQKQSGGMHAVPEDGGDSKLQAKDAQRLSPTESLGSRSADVSSGTSPQAADPEYVQQIRPNDAYEYARPPGAAKIMSLRARPSPTLVPAVLSRLNSISSNDFKRLRRSAPSDAQLSPNNGSTERSASQTERSASQPAAEATAQAVEPDAAVSAAVNARCFTAESQSPLSTMTESEPSTPERSPRRRRSQQLPKSPLAPFALDKRRSTERIQAAAREAEEAGLAAPPAESDETIQVNVTLSDQKQSGGMHAVPEDGGDSKLQAKDAQPLSPTESSGSRSAYVLFSPQEAYVRHIRPNEDYEYARPPGAAKIMSPCSRPSPTFVPAVLSHLKSISSDDFNRLRRSAASESQLSPNKGSTEQAASQPAEGPVAPGAAATAAVNARSTAEPHSPLSTMTESEASTPERSPRRRRSQQLPKPPKTPIPAPSTELTSEQRAEARRLWLATEVDGVDLSKGEARWLQNLVTQNQKATAQLAQDLEEEHRRALSTSNHGIGAVVLGPLREENRPTGLSTSPEDHSPSGSVKRRSSRRRTPHTDAAATVASVGDGDTQDQALHEVSPSRQLRVDQTLRV